MKYFLLGCVGWDQTKSTPLSGCSTLLNHQSFANPFEAKHHWADGLTHLALNHSKIRDLLFGVKWRLLHKMIDGLKPTNWKRFSSRRQVLIFKYFSPEQMHVILRCLKNRWQTHEATVWSFVCLLYFKVDLNKKISYKGGVQILQKQWSFTFSGGLNIKEVILGLTHTGPGLPGLLGAGNWNIGARPWVSLIDI